MIIAKNYKEWRKLVFAKDNNICQLCGTTDNLIIDHIKPKREEPKLSLVVENGRVLCRSCHICYGKKIPNIKRKTTKINTHNIICQTRQLIRLGGSLCITLPSEFVKLNKIKQGDLLSVTGNEILTFIPMQER